MKAPTDTIEMRRLLRDHDGFVHTPRGYISGAAYDKMREANPEYQYPLRSDIPLMSDLSDEDLKRWYGELGPLARAALTNSLRGSGFVRRR